MVGSLVLFIVAVFLMDLPQLEGTDPPPHLVKLARENQSAKMEIRPPVQMYSSLDRVLSRLGAHERSIEELAAQARPVILAHNQRKESTVLELVYWLYMN